MAKFRILKKDGSPSAYFWTDKDGTESTAKRVYKKTTDGIKRIRNIRFNAVTKRMRRITS